MLFDGAVKKLHIAKKAILDKDIEKAHNELTKVQKIFTELMVALDFEKGGELATDLMRIYDFVYHHLVRTNIRQDAVMIDEVLPIVENLRDGWTQAVEKYMADQEGKSEKTVEAAHPAEPAVTAPSKATLPTPPKPALNRYQAVSSSAPTGTSTHQRVNLRG